MIQVGLFMSDTGGGHRSAGRAIEAALTLRYPDTFFCDYFDVFRVRGSAWWSHHWDIVVVFHPAFNGFAVDSDALTVAMFANAAVQERLHNHPVERVIVVPSKPVSNVVRGDPP